MRCMANVSGSETTTTVAPAAPQVDEAERASRRRTMENIRGTLRLEDGDIPATDQPDWDAWVEGRITAEERNQRVFARYGVDN